MQHAGVQALSPRNGRQTVSQDDDKTTRKVGTDDNGQETYERPEVIDYGILTELTLSGHGSMSDGLMAGGS